jgi:hypothetical protein
VGGRSGVELHQHAKDVFGEPACGDAAAADGVDAGAEPLGVPAGGRAVEERANVGAAVGEAHDGLVAVRDEFVNSRCMSANASAALAAVNRLNASLPS